MLSYHIPCAGSNLEATGSRLRRISLLGAVELVNSGLSLQCLPFVI
jgi:hypothetical protein